MHYNSYTSAAPSPASIVIKAKDAFAGEVLCTFLLVVTVFSATDAEVGRKFKHTGALLPLSIGMAVLLGEQYEYDTGSITFMSALALLYNHLRRYVGRFCIHIDFFRLLKHPNLTSNIGRRCYK